MDRLDGIKVDILVAQQSLQKWVHDGTEYVIGQAGQAYTIRVSRARLPVRAASADGHMAPGQPVALRAFVDGKRVLCREADFLPLWPKKSRTLGFEKAEVQGWGTGTTPRSMKFRLKHTGQKALVPQLACDSCFFNKSCKVEPVACLFSKRYAAEKCFGLFHLEPLNARIFDGCPSTPLQDLRRIRGTCPSHSLGGRRQRALQ